MSSHDPVHTPRGEATRNALIAAAIEAFGRDGFDAASTRAIAEAAGANQALIGYHFGGKPGLYLAALQHIVDRIGRRLGPLVAAIEAEIGERGGGTAAERALALLQQLLDAFLEMLTSEESAAWARLILREQQDPSAGFDLLYTTTMQRLLVVMTRLIGCVRGAEPDAAATRLTALTLVGQVLVFRVARAAILRQMGWKRIGPGEVRAVRAELRRNIQAILMEHPQQ
jgi:AcrR family transcriptional regulator